VARLTSACFFLSSRCYFPGIDQAFFRLAFFRQAFAFLDAATFVEMYFPFAATSPALFNAHDANPTAVGTSSMMYNNDGTISAVGQLLLSA
jgi:hypothetical protein